MSALMWLIAGINLGMWFQQLPHNDWTQLSAGIVALTAGLFVE